MSSLVRFFGTSAANPSIQRGFACIGLVSEANSKEDEDITLLDCGDGSIRKIMETKTNPLSISSILITHFHSDHLSGLAQVIETMNIWKSTKNLNVYGPVGLKEYFSLVQSTMNVASKRQFEVNIRELDVGEKLLLGDYHVTSLPMEHTIPCLGYRIESPKFVVAYTGDTEPCNSSISLVRNADLLIHEATFLERDRAKARESKHSTPKEAAETAIKGSVRNLVLTHINDKVETEQEMIEEATPIYEATRVAYDALEITL